MTPIWTTKDGREIPIDQMEDDHLVNTILMLTRGAGFDHELSIWRLANYAGSAPDGAAMAAEMALAEAERFELWDVWDQLDPFLPVLLAEARRRNLPFEDRLSEHFKEGQRKCFYVLLKGVAA